MAFSMEDCSLQGKVALVTGGSRGIGRAIAVGFAKAGADLALASRKLPDLEEAANEIRGLGRKCQVVAAHIGRMEDIERLVKEVVAEYGKIDILVNNAATNPTVDGSIDITERAWDSLFNLNLKGLFFLSQAVARVMRDKGAGGSIINVASIDGIKASTVLPIYGISKAAVIHTTKTHAKEWAKFNIRVNVIAPGLTKTRFSEYLWTTPDILSKANEATPLGRIAEPDEMVGAAVYLASSAASYTTGQCIAIDGGRTV